VSKENVLKTKKEQEATMVKRVVIVVMFLVFLFAVTGRSVLASVAKDQLKVSMDKLIAVLADESLKGPEKETERRAKIFEVFKERFDFKMMGMRSLGAPWKELSPEQRDEYVTSFSELIKNSYILKIERYTNEKIVFKDDRAKGKYYYVYTDILSGDTAIPINYSLYQKGDQWFVYDVTIEGVSLVKNYRSQFDQIYRKEGFSGLMSKINKQLSTMESEGQK
jgi:phospholipid transport system substrate-binding protein